MLYFYMNTETENVFSEVPLLLNFEHDKLLQYSKNIIYCMFRIWLQCFIRQTFIEIERKYILVLCSNILF